MNTAIKYNFKALLFLTLFLTVSQNAHAFIAQDGTVTTNPGSHYYIYETATDGSYIREFNGYQVPDPIPGTVAGMEAFWSQGFTGTTWIESVGLDCFSLTRTQCEATALSTAVYPVPVTPPPVGGGTSIRFLKETIEPSSMIASVKAGTVDTADKTLPLLVFLGIPLGFLLVLMLINMISATLSPEKKGVKSEDLQEFNKKNMHKQGLKTLDEEIEGSKKSDFIYHSAEDLEFKRNYGRRRE